MAINPGTVSAWTGVIAQLVGLGVSSFSQIKPMMQSVNVDDETIAQLESEWDDLYERVKRASGQT